MTKVIGTAKNIVTVGRSEREAISLDAGPVLFTKDVFGSRLISSNGWGMIVGADASGEVRLSYKLMRSFHPVYGGIAQGKLVHSPFKEGAALRLVLALTSEKVAQREKDGKTLDVFDSVLRIVDFQVLSEGTGEAQVYHPYVKREQGKPASTVEATKVSGGFEADLDS